MHVAYSYKVRSGRQRLYAVGSHSSVIGAIRATFTKHGMRIHREKEKTFTHFPGGWPDRAVSAFDRFSSVSGGPLANAFTITYTPTNNPSVMLLDLQLYHKTSFLSKRLTESRIAKFFSAFRQEFAISEIPLVDADDWPTMLTEYPHLQCSPYWPTEAEIQASIDSKKSNRT
jgi:hypothetical protein